MWEYVVEVLGQFRGQFTRAAAFRWFANVVVGLMIREDRLGVTSIIRALGLDGRLYDSLIHFFRADSWTVEGVRKVWIGVVAKCGLLYREHGMPVLAGDGTKEPKEGRKMPAVKKLGQESENSAKPEYIRGHMFGGLGVVVGTAEKLFCTLLSLRIHDGNEIIGKWAEDENEDEDELAEVSHVRRMVIEAGIAARTFGNCVLALDRAFLTAPMIEEVDKLTAAAEGAVILSVVTRAKNNVVGYYDPEQHVGRGRPRKKGASVKVAELFETEADSFTDADVFMYGETKAVKYLVKDLLWGQGLYRKLRFVLVQYGDARVILVSTNLELTAEEIIRTYSIRFKIEGSFREFKQVISGFAYHFWTSAMPKLKRFGKNDETREQLEAITDEKQKSKIVETFKAIEGFAMFSVIALGILQLVSLKFKDEINGSAFRWLRTKRNNVPSEATAADFMRKTIFKGFPFRENFGIPILFRSA